MTLSENLRLDLSTGWQMFTATFSRRLMTARIKVSTVFYKDAVKD